MHHTILDDYDYTLCTHCDSQIQPYNNPSITTITSIIHSTNITSSTLSKSNPFIATLISYNTLHCQKCGLYIEIHPKHNNTQREISSKLFICSAQVPHRYCLCYHCGLLYGMNPNQKSIDIITVLKTSLNKEEKDNDNDNEEEEEQSLELEVDDDDDHSDDENIKNMTEIDESYKHLIALQNKLHFLSNIDGGHQYGTKTMSCPSSPHIKTKKRNLTKSQSLRQSPLFRPSTPSPRVLERNIDETEKKWQQYLSHQHNTLLSNESTNVKLEKQQKKLEELEKLQRELSIQKRNSEQFAKLFRNGIYSKDNVKMTNFKLQT